MMERFMDVLLDPELTDFVGVRSAPDDEAPHELRQASIAIWATTVTTRAPLRRDCKSQLRFRIRRNTQGTGLSSAQPERLIRKPSSLQQIFIHRAVDRSEGRQTIHSVPGASKSKIRGLIARMRGAPCLMFHPELRRFLAIQFDHPLCRLLLDRVCSAHACSLCSVL